MRKSCMSKVNQYRFDTSVYTEVWPGGVVVRALDLRLKCRGFESRPFRFQLTQPWGQVVHTHVPL